MKPTPPKKRKRSEDSESLVAAEEPTEDREALEIPGSIPEAEEVQVKMPPVNVPDPPQVEALSQVQPQAEDAQAEQAVVESSVQVPEDPKSHPAKVQDVQNLMIKIRRGQSREELAFQHKKLRKLQRDKAIFEKRAINDQVQIIGQGQIQLIPNGVSIICDERAYKGPRNVSSISNQSENTAKETERKPPEEGSGQRPERPNL